jgi:hypothetical protein
MNEKIYHLKQIRQNMDEDTFRFTVATITIKHYLKLLELKRSKMDRTKLLIRVNGVLRSIGCEEVSYGFLRKFI